MDHIYENLLKMVDMEIEYISTEKELNRVSLDNLGKLIDIRKDIMELKSYDKDGEEAERPVEAVSATARRAAV